MPKVFNITLSQTSIQDAISKLRQYRTDLDTSMTLLSEEVGKIVQRDAQNMFDGAIADDLTEKSGGAVMAEVNVESEPNGNESTVTAYGNDAVSVEFGTGVHHNGGAGSSPHPRGAMYDMLIGEYGKKQGRKDKWAIAPNVWSYGTPARMPMYNALEQVQKEVPNIAKQVMP